MDDRARPYTYDRGAEGPPRPPARRRAATRAGDDDAELVARLADGDRTAALEELYDRYARTLFGLGVRLLGDRGLAEELVQETFVRLWRAAPRFDPDRGSVHTFVFALARHIAVDLWRRPSSRPLHANRDPDLPAPDDPIVTKLVVRDALDSLTPRHRDVLELSYGHGLTQAEIAQRLGLPLGTVKTRTYYALRALKLALEERGLDV